MITPDLSARVDALCLMAVVYPALLAGVMGACYLFAKRRK